MFSLPKLDGSLFVIDDPTLTSHEPTMSSYLLSASRGENTSLASTQRPVCTSKRIGR